MLKMTHEDVKHLTDAVSSLPDAEAATCVLLAARKCLPKWQKWACAHDIPDLSQELINCFERWREGQASSNDLWTIGSAFRASLPTDLREEHDPLGGFAGHALDTVVLLAVDDCGDVRVDLLHTSILYAAAASCGIEHEAVSGDTERLTREELEFITAWWTECCQTFPVLPKLLEGWKQAWEQWKQTRAEL